MVINYNRSKSRTLRFESIIMRALIILLVCCFSMNLHSQSAIRCDNMYNSGNFKGATKCYEKLNANSPYKSDGTPYSAEEKTEIEIQKKKNKSKSPTVYEPICSLSTPVTTKQIYNGVNFLITKWGGQQVYFSISYDNDGYQGLVLLLNNTSQPIDFNPNEIMLVGTNNSTRATTGIKVFSADEYEKKLQGKVRSAMFWRGFVGGLANAPLYAPTYSNVQVRDYYGGSYVGTVRNPPNYAAIMQANQQLASQNQAYQQQRIAENAAAMTEYLRGNTILPGNYYGGYFRTKKQKKDVYEVTIPFGGCDFKFPFTFQ